MYFAFTTIKLRSHLCVPKRSSVPPPHLLNSAEKKPQPGSLAFDTRRSVSLKLRSIRNFNYITWSRRGKFEDGLHGCALTEVEPMSFRSDAQNTELLVSYYPSVPNYLY